MRAASQPPLIRPPIRLRAMLPPPMNAIVVFSMLMNVRRVSDE